MIADVKNSPKPPLSEIAAVQFFVETFEVLMYLWGESKEVHYLGNPGSAETQSPGNVGLIPGLPRLYHPLEPIGILKSLQNRRGS